MRNPRESVAIAIAAVALASTGCAHSSAPPDRTRATVGDVDAGKRVFQTNCATCHGESGTEGGVGPSLRGERARKDFDATLVWIKHPAPPMPALYPSPLTDADVTDVATYVQSL